MIKKYKKFNESKKFPDLRKLDIDGFTVYVGKDAKSNDYLTFNIAEDSDLWFHASGFPGSHVVIKVQNNLPTEVVIKKVAELAKKYSKGSKESNIKVVYCQRKFVSKERGSADGKVKVDYINSYMIMV